MRYGDRMSEPNYVRVSMTDSQYAALCLRAQARLWPLTITARDAMVLGLELQRREAGGDRVILRSLDGSEEPVRAGGML